MSFTSTLLEAITFKNMLIIVKSTVVRGHLLFLLATVLVWRTGGKPSIWFPPGTRKADSKSLYFLSDFFFQVEEFRYLFGCFRNSLKIFQKMSSFSKK